MTIGLDGKVALVTGAGRGLGRAYALDLARCGARVVVNDANIGLDGAAVAGESPGERVVAEIVAAGGEALPDRGNVGDPHDAAAMVEAAVARWGRIDVVVCNAGHMRKLTFSETSASDMAGHFAAHVMGSFLVCKAAWPHMVGQGNGRIVLTTSQVGMYGQRDAAAYGVAKMGVLGLMHGMKLEAAEHGIRVNAISPFALTRMGEGTFPEAMRPYIDPALVAPAVTWLASDACDWNGDVLIAGGGHFARAACGETVGWNCDDIAALDAETIDARMAEITAQSDMLFPADALTAVGRTFERLEALSGTVAARDA